MNRGGWELNRTRRLPTLRRFPYAGQKLSEKPDSGFGRPHRQNPVGTLAGEELPKPSTFWPRVSAFGLSPPKKLHYRDAVWSPPLLHRQPKPSGSTPRSRKPGASLGSASLPYFFSRNGPGFFRSITSAHAAPVKTKPGERQTRAAPRSSAAPAQEPAGNPSLPA